MAKSNRSLVDLDTIGALFADGVAKATELMHIGLTSNTVYSRCRPGGPWQRLLPGVLLLSSATPTRLQLARAALCYAGPEAILTGHDALQLLGLKSAQPSGPVHVLIPLRQQIRSDSNIQVERTTRMPNPLMRKGLLTAPVTRAVLDTARRLTSLDRARALIAEAVQRQFTKPEELRAELERGSNRGSALPRKVLVEISDGVRSAAEAWARTLVKKADLPTPQWNVPICTSCGTLLGVVDAWWDDVGLVWEIDSYEFHLSPKAYAATLKRHSKLTAAGLVVVHTVPARLRREPRVVLEELRQAYEHAAARPRPPVTAQAAR